MSEIVGILSVRFDRPPVFYRQKKEETVSGRLSEQ
jgi:hypothetical protein